MKTVKVNASRQYDVLIAKGLLNELGKLLSSKVEICKICLVTDDIVDSLYGAKAVEALLNVGFEVEKYVIVHGEASKNPQNLINIVNFMAEKQFTRKDIMVALGGGVIGDLCGFCASTYMRGIKFIQVPTTLLAMVDSSVGGKTAVDLPNGKNLFGTFWQPSLVVCDTDTLDTLGSEIFADGMAEVIKYGMIFDKDFFASLEAKNISIEDIIFRCVEIKRDIVNQDEFEAGLRQLLNFGHTIGHAVEALSDYKISHGSAVAIGMAVVTKYLVRNNKLDKGAFDKLIAVLKAYNLPTECPYGAEEIYKKMLNDKKRSNNSINFVFIDEIGSAQISKIKINDAFSLIEEGIR